MELIESKFKLVKNEIVLHWYETIDSRIIFVKHFPPQLSVDEVLLEAVKIANERQDDGRTIMDMFWAVRDVIGRIDDNEFRLSNNIVVIPPSYFGRMSGLEKPRCFIHTDAGKYRPLDPGQNLYDRTGQLLRAVP